MSEQFYIGNKQNVMLFTLFKAEVNQKEKFFLKPYRYTSCCILFDFFIVCSVISGVTEKTSAMLRIATFLCLPIHKIQDCIETQKN